MMTRHRENCMAVLRYQLYVVDEMTYLGEKLRALARAQTDRHKSENRGHAFRVSGFVSNFTQPIIKERSNICLLLHLSVKMTHNKSNRNQKK